MTIHKKAVENKLEKDLITHSIMSTAILSQVFPLMDDSILKVSYSKLVWNWVKEYYIQYNKAPEKDIQSIYIFHAANVGEDADIIGQLLTTLSDSYTEPHNTDYVIKTLTDYIRKRSIEILIERLSHNLTKGAITECENNVATYSKKELLKTSTINVTNDVHGILDSFEEKEDVLFRFPNAIGMIMGNVSRGTLLGICAYKGRLKSYLTLRCCEEAMKKGANVLYVNMEMTENELRQRWFKSIKGVADKTGNIKYPMFYRDTEDSNEKWKIEFKEVHKTQYIPTVEDITETLNNVRIQYGGQFRIMSIPSKTVTLKQLEERIQNLEVFEGFELDVLAVDYPELLKTSGKDEKRTELADIFAILRGWALDKNIGIITPIQLNRASLSMAMVDESAIAEADGIIAHLTNCVALSGTKQELEHGLNRIVQLKARNSRIYTDQVVTLSCLGYGKSFYDSRFLQHVEYDILKKEEESKR